MLEGETTSPFSATVRQITIAARVTRTLQEMEISMENMEDLNSFLERYGLDDDPQRLVDMAFDVPTQFKSVSRSRFHRPPRSAFYSAIEWQTAEAEVGHRQQVRMAVVGTAGYRTAYFHGLEVQFDGQIFDLRMRLEQFPFLVESTEQAYESCNALADEARSRNAHGLLTVSARRPEGTCVPIFVKDALSAPQRVRRYRASRTPDTDQIELQQME